MLLSNVFAVYLFLCLLLSGLWNQLRWMSIAIPLALGVLVFGLVRQRFSQKVQVFARPKKSRRDAARGIITGLFIWFPALFYFAGTYGQEFPFLGDHAHHVIVLTNVVEYWRDYFLLVAALTVGLILAYRKWRRLEWIWVAFGICVGMSIVTPTYEYLARYPAGMYSLGVPLRLMFDTLGWADLLNVNRWVTVLSIGAWLFVFRPLLLGRWPDRVLLPVALFFFFQKDIVYYASSAYLDVPAVCLVLLGMEVSWVEGKRRPWLGVLICGMAAMVKEQAILAVPVAWVLGYGFSFTKDSVATGLVAVSPFLTYWAFRSAQEGRPFAWGSPAQMLVSRRLELFEARIMAQFHQLGILSIIISGILVLYGVVRKHTWAVPLLVAVLCAFGIEVIALMDRVSVPWTGLPRFHLIPLAILAVGGFAVAYEWLDKKNQGALVLMSLGMAVMQGLPLVKAVREQLSEDYKRNFVEHFNSPLYFPIRALVENAEEQGFLTPGSRENPQALYMLDPLMDSHYSNWAQTGYRDLMKKYELRVSSSYSLEDCGCRPSHPNQMVTLVYKDSGLLRELAAVQWTGRDMHACIRKISSTCQQVVSETASDGTVVGVLGIGLRKQNLSVRH